MRSHGGAIRIQDSVAEIPYLERESTNTIQKKAIARLAIQHIAAHDRILLDASSTAWHIARGIPDIPLTVVMNSIKVALELVVKSNIQMISTGGFLRASSLSYVGMIAEYSLE
jgi:DeoR/GlpR family transcriptional regulator of sugar metabolism